MKSVAREEYPDWVKIPATMQHQFFELAEQEAKKTKQKLLEDAEKLKMFRQLLKFEKVQEDNQWKNWRIACVDGSDSPIISERIGGRYGTYAAGYMIFEGNKLAKEDYFSGMISHEQIGDQEFTKKILELFCTKLERETAIHCLKHENIDLLLIDGSFFGFRTRCSEVINKPINVEGFRRGGDLVDYVRNKSIHLMESKKVVAVIKRVRTSAFDGWIAHKEGNENRCINRNDRDILASIMPSGHWFAYEWSLGMPEAFNYFTWFRTTLEQYPGRSMETILKESTLRAINDIKLNLRCPSSDIFKTSRYYMRCINSALPFCFETHKDIDVRPLVAYFQANHNKVTGLPFPIDLIDQNVTLPRRFTKEFVEEIEAILVRDHELDKYSLSNHFMSINPQKEE